MRTQPLIKTMKDTNIVSLYLQGLSYPEICKELKTSNQTIKKALEDKDAKLMIQRAHQEMVLMLPQAVNVYRDGMEDDDKAIRVKCADRVAQTTGILPSHSQSIYINNLYQQNNQFGDQIFLGMARSFLGLDKGSDDDIITVSPDTDGK